MIFSNRLKRIVAGVTIAALVGTNLAGCIAVPEIPQSMSGVTQGLQNALQQVGMGNGLNGPLRGESLQLAEEAKAIYDRLDAGTYRIGYSTPEFTSRMQRFTAARQNFSAAGDNPTQAQFVELYEAMGRMLIYADSVESLREQSRNMRSGKANQDEYVIQPGESTVFATRGYCLDYSTPAPATGEPLQLIKLDRIWPEPMIDAYQHLIAQHDPKGNGLFSTSPHNSNIQAAIWAMQAARDGDLTSERLSGLSPEQILLLTQAGFDPAAMVRSGLSVEGISRIATNMARNVAENAINTQVGQITRRAGAITNGNPALRDLVNALPVNPADIMANPAVLGDPAVLGESLDRWMENQSRQSARPSAPREEGMTMLAPGVAASTRTTMPLRANVSITNTSNQPFTFRPAEYAMNARTASQPVGLAQWDQQSRERGVQLVTSAQDNQIRGAMMDDLRLLGMEKGLRSMIRNEGLTKALISSTFNSKVMRNNLSNIPVLGSVIAVGQLITGRNLDGSEMGGWDYVGAAISVLPATRVLSRVLGGPGLRVMRRELQKADGFFERHKGIGYGVDVLGSNTFETGASAYPGWMDRHFERGAREAINALPETGAYLSQNGVRMAF